MGSLLFGGLANCLAAFGGARHIVKNMVGGTWWTWDTFLLAGVMFPPCPPLIGVVGLVFTCFGFAGHTVLTGSHVV